MNGQKMRNNSTPWWKPWTRTDARGLKIYSVRKMDPSNRRRRRRSVVTSHQLVIVVIVVLMPNLVLPFITSSSPTATSTKLTEQQNLPTPCWAIGAMCEPF